MPPQKSRQYTPEELRQLRELCFVPCETSADLWRWCAVYLGVQLPEGRVDPDSNSSPMEFLWEVYQILARGGDPQVQRVMAYASRDSFKTLVAAVVETIAAVHFQRGVVHLAAVEDQSKKCARYVRQFLDRPILQDFRSGNNKRELEIVRYQRIGDLRENLTEKQWRALPELLRSNYERWSVLNEITVCTLQGANSKHAPLLILDEVDVIANPVAYEEAKGIPSPPEHDPDQYPLTLLFSTRKTSIGLVQKEIDEAPRSGLKVRHWNIVDVTRRCPEDRHRPDLPRLPIYVEEKTATALSESDWVDLPPKRQEFFSKKEGYAGCLLNCRLFGSCEGRLATAAKREVPHLKQVSYTDGRFRQTTSEMWVSQYMCRKPPKSGLVYPRLDEDLHLKTPQQVADMVLVDPRPGVDTPEKLIALLRSLGVRWGMGHDYGFTHPFAAPFSAVFGAIIIVVDYIEESGLDDPEKVERCKKFLPFNPDVWGDTESPGSIRTFRKAGFRMRDWKKGRVRDGIEDVRSKLRPPSNEPELIFVKTESVLRLWNRLTKYHYKIDKATGEPTEEVDDVDDDGPDALRYMVTNLRGGTKAVLAAGADEPLVDKPAEVPSLFQQMMNTIGGVEEPAEAVVRGRGKIKVAI